jgi:hypothetical protein
MADPTPLGEAKEKAPQSLLPLIPDLIYPPAPLAPKWLYDGPLDVLPMSLLSRARLDTGTKLEGVSYESTLLSLRKKVLLRGGYMVDRAAWWYLAIGRDFVSRADEFSMNKVRREVSAKRMKREW